jgi:alpha-beta hydrolase superfamily lysophospholipase
LVHGLGEHTGRYSHVAEHFTRAGFVLAGCDLPGHGQSEGKRGCMSFEEGVGEIDRLLQETAARHPGCPQFLYGHSMGGALVLYYSLERRPEITGAIVTSPGLASGSPVPGWKFTLARIMSRVYPTLQIANGLDRNNLSHDPEVIRAYENDPLVHDRISARLGFDTLTLGDRIIEQAVDFPIPLLLMQGDQDFLVSPKATAAFAQRVPAQKLTYKVWEGLYHETHNEFEKDQVIQTMVDWLNQHI